MLEFSKKSENKEVAELLTFDGPPFKLDVERRAERLMEIAAEEKVEKVLIDTEYTFLITGLEIGLISMGIRPFFKYSDFKGVEYIESFFEVDDTEE